MGASVAVEIQTLAQLGKGRFGTVHCWRDESKKLFAVKKYDVDVIASDLMIKNEVDVLSVISNINSEYLLKLYGTKQNGNVTYLLMEPYLGGSLHTHISRSVNARLDFHVAKVYIAEIVSGLICLKEHKIVHRDLKANNILLDHNGRLKICDFGFAKLLSKKEDRTYSIVGSLHCIAPEMVACGRKSGRDDVVNDNNAASVGSNVSGYSYSVDWWALGVLLFEMLTGLPPDWPERFKSETTVTRDPAAIDSPHQAATGNVNEWPTERDVEVASAAVKVSFQSKGVRHDPVDNILSAGATSTTDDKKNEYGSSKLMSDVKASWFLLPTHETLLSEALQEHSLEIGVAAVDLLHKLLCPSPLHRWVGNREEQYREQHSSTNDSHSTAVDSVARHNSQHRSGLKVDNVCSHPFLAGTKWDAVHSGASPVGNSDFDRRYGFLELFSEFDLSSDVVSDSDQMLFDGF